MVSEGVLCSNERSWEKKSSQGRGAERDLIVELGQDYQYAKIETRTSLGQYLLGFSNSFRLGDGTMVPVEEVEEAEEEESVGDPGGRSAKSSSSSCSSCSSRMAGGSGGRRDRWARAKDL